MGWLGKRVRFLFDWVPEEEEGWRVEEEEEAKAVEWS